MRRVDVGVAAVFFALTLATVGALSSSQGFYEWAWARHHNQLSWYIRPLFLVPYCVAAHQRSWSGIAIAAFATTTSMFWFPAPEVADARVEQFLAFEMAWLEAPWTLSKVLQVLLVPISMGALALAFWRRNLILGALILPMIAIGKITWSVQNAGEDGLSIVIPAVIGLILCLGALAWVLRRSGGQVERPPSPSAR